MPLCLVVDDEEDHREIASLVAKSVGFEVHVEKDSISAFDFCKTTSPDLILLDWMMPDLDGVEFMYRLRKLNEGLKPRIVMCSARNSENAINMAYSMGANFYLTKPFNPEDLSAVLEQIFDDLQETSD